MKVLNSISRSLWVVPKRIPLVYKKPLFQLATKRFITEKALLKESDLGEDDNVSNTGVILKQARESLLFFGHMTPFKASKYDFMHFFGPIFYDVSDKGLTKRIISLAQSNDLPLEIVSFTPVKRDGGAFVKFKVPEGMPVQDFNKQVIANVKSRQGDGMINYLIHPRCFAVKGTPWIEDLRRYPSPKLKLTFEGPELSQENLYLLFRRYGTISDIIPPAADAKDRSTIVAFMSINAAIAARQCITGLEVSGTTVHAQYIPIVRVNLISDFISKHSRIAIPLIIAVLAGFAVIIFDPIRYFFVYGKITGAYSLQNNYYYQETMKLFTTTTMRVSDMLSLSDKFKHEDGSVVGLWVERNDKAKEIKLWIEENVNSFIVVQGPRGSGKRNLVEDYVLKDRKNTVYIDCDNLIKARKEHQFLKQFADELGYYPVFAWLSTVSSFIDLVVQGLTGQKSGISESKESQVRNMLSLSSNVIRDIALVDYRKITKDSEFPLKEEDYLQQNPQAKPVIVINRYQASKKSSHQNAFIYKEIADWAANLVALNVAHVIIITDDVGSLQTLSRSLPSPPFKRSLLSDASAVSAQNYIFKQLESDESPAINRWVKDEKSKAELTSCIAPFGGRMLDLQMFIRRIKSGETPKEALGGIVTQSVEQLSQIFISDASSPGSATSLSDVGYSGSQAWCIIKRLAEKDHLTYKEVFSMPLFKTDSFKILSAMENSELITIIRANGLVEEIRPSKPLYKLAFETMVNDKRVYTSLEADYLSYLIKAEFKKIAGLEDELTKFRGIGDSNVFKGRLQYLAAKIDSSTKNIINCEKELIQLSNS